MNYKPANLGDKKATTVAEMKINNGVAVKYC